MNARPSCITILSLAAASLLAACNSGGGGSGGGGGGGGAGSGKLFALTDGGNLQSFDRADPAGATSVALAGHEFLSAAEFDPATGALVAIKFDFISGTGTLVTVDTATGAVTPVGGAGFPSPAATSPADIAIDAAGSVITFVDDQGDNFSLHADGSLLSTDAPLAYVAGDANQGKAPSIVGVAFDGTTAYGVDRGDAVGGPTLVRIGDAGGAPHSVTSGELHTIGALGAGVSISFFGPLVIDPATHTGFLTAYSTSNDFFSIDLATGVATAAGTIPVPAGDGNIPALALAP